MRQRLSGRIAIARRFVANFEKWLEEDVVTGPSRCRGSCGYQKTVVVAVVTLVVLAAIWFASTEAGRAWLLRMDSEWLGERMKDSLGRLRSREDWSAAEPLRPNQNYAWLMAGGAPVRIAHALGEAGMPTANTLGAMQRSYEAGFRVFEVDLVLEDDEMRCQHDPGPQVSIQGDGCTFDRLMEALPGDAHLLLDIKADFSVVGQRIVDRLKGSDRAMRVVFQLYRPEDFAMFNAWQRQAALAGPVITVYLANRSLAHITGQISRLGVAVLTIPLHRLRALPRRPSNISVMTHPIHDLQACLHAMAARVQGIYVINTVTCSE